MAYINKAGAYVALVAPLLFVAGAHAASPAARCEAAKLKIAGKYSLCRVAAQAKGVKIGPGAETSGDFAKCDATFAKKWAAAEKKGGTACPTSGDAGRVQLLVDQLAMTAGFTLAGVRFIDNGDETITDTQTGLMWEKKDNLDQVLNYGDPHDADNFYTWSSSDNAPDGTVFTDFLGQLNNCVSDGTTMVGGFAGHCDWRLPNLFELIEILDIGVPGCGGAFNPCIEPAFLPAIGSEYWTSTTDTANLNNVWIVRFLLPLPDSNVFVDSKTTPDFVRAVRSGR